jgi:membrane-associated phospholipid phosphatase
MQSQYSNIKSCKTYFIGLIIVVLFTASFLLYSGKTVAFLSLNSYHSFWLNVFFINYTFIGDGIFALCLITLLYCYFKKKEQSIAMLYAFLLSGVAVQIIKNLVSAPRPKLFFEAGQYMFFIDDVVKTGNASFPSGHTTTAFAIATVAVMLIKNRNWQLPILIAAVLVGYSRIYLAQHFLIDVIIGASIGCLSGITAIYLVQNGKQLKKRFKKMHRISKNTLPTNSPSPIQPA